MAVFGPQLIFTVIMFVLLTKLGKFYSFGRFLLCHKLFRYLSPGAKDLKKSVRNFYKSSNSTQVYFVHPCSFPHIDRPLPSKTKTSA